MSGRRDGIVALQSQRHDQRALVDLHRPTQIRKTSDQQQAVEEGQVVALLGQPREIGATSDP